MDGGESKRRFAGDGRLSRRRENPPRGSARRALEDGVHFPGHLRPDPYRNRFPPNWAVVGAVMLAAAGLYAWGGNGLPTPGAATAATLDQLLPRVRLPLTGLWWGVMVRVAMRVHVSTLTARMAFLSAAFGAAAAGLLAALMLRMGYLVRNEVPESALVREAQARKLSALAAGLFLAATPPAWLAATRSLPTTFHLLLALGGVWALSEFQRKGGRWRLGCAAFWWTAIALECPGTVLFWPATLSFGVKEIFHRNLQRSARTWLAAAAGLAAGTGTWWLAAWRVWRWRQAAGAGPGSLAAALGALARAATADWMVLRFSPALLVFVSILLIPCGVLFCLSRRCPWFYEQGEVLIRVLFGAGLAGVVWHAVYSPAFLVGGVQNPALLPQAVLAVCFGYVAGEFWILGQQGLGPGGGGRRQWRKTAASAVALALPLSVALAPLHTHRAVVLPRGHWSLRLADDMLDRAPDRKAVVAAAPMDDSVLLSIVEKGRGHFPLSPSRAGDKVYLGWLGRLLPASNPAKAHLENGAYQAALQAWLEDDGLLETTLVADHPMFYREYAWLSPAGIGYRMWAKADGADPARAAAAEEPFWRTVAEDPLRLPDEHPHAPYLKFFRDRVARAANDTGVALAERGDEAKAEELFRLALQIDPDHLSARMNLLRMCEKRHPGEPETAGMRAAWERDLWGAGGKKWGLEPRYGLVWEAEEWMREGAVWALSGVPLSPPAARRRNAPGDAVDEHFARWLDWAFLVRGDPDWTERNYREWLMGNPWDADSVLALGRLALKAKRWDIAEAYVREAVAMGRTEESVLFERTMNDFLQLAMSGAFRGSAPEAWREMRGGIEAGRESLPGGETGRDAVESRMSGTEGEGALRLHDASRWRRGDGGWRDPREVFRQLAGEAVGDMRIWMTLYLLGGDGNEYGRGRIERILTTQRPNDPALWLTLADVHATEGDWSKAKKEIRKAMELDVARVALWELALTMAEHYSNRELFLAAQKQLTRLQPNHYMVFQNTGNDLYAQGDLQGAIRTFRQGVFLKRDPVLLNNLAYVLNEASAENYEDALSLVDEAIMRNPKQARFWDTRAAIHQSHGAYQEALRDVMELIRREPTRANHLTAAEICRKAGWKATARQLLEQIPALPGNMDFREQERMRDLQRWVEEGE